jgi:hypothetical protein
MDEDHENNSNSNNNNNKTAGDNSVDEPKSNTSKDIKKGMDRCEAKIKSGEAPTGDATRSDE